MSTVWSGWRGGLAVGIDVSVSPSNVTASTSSVTVSWTIWARNDSTHGTGSYTWSCSGAHTDSGSGSGGYPSWGTTWKVASFTSTLATSYSGAVSATLNASVVWTSTGANPTLSRTITVGTRPPYAPAAPSAVHASTSGSSSVAVSWVRPSNASDPSTIWSNAVVQRQVDSYSTTGWKTVATLSGSATSWSDTNVSANHQYFYRVFSKNVTGQSWAPTNSESWVQTTPAAPTSVVAKRSGSNIVVSWRDNSPFDNGWKLEDSPDGSSWSVVSATIPASGSSYTHVSPSTSVTHRYRVTAHTSNGLSAVSAVSNVVTLISPPAAPTGLGPSVVATGSSAAFTWTHNPTDTSDQTAYEVLWSTDSGATWSDTGQVTSGVSSWDASAVAAVAGSVQWQVRTWGASPTAGPYSAVVTTTVSSTPTVAITAPSGTVDLSSTEVDWTYGQAEASPQAAWSVTITDTDGNAVDSGSGTGTTSSWTSGNTLADASDYTATVTVTSTAGLSATTQQPFAVAYDAPVPPTVTLDDQVVNGFIGVTVACTSNGVDPDAVEVILERSIDGGDWVTLTDSTDVNFTFSDFGCTLTGTNSYRVTAVSALPSQSTTTISYASPELSGASYVILGTGSGLADVLRFSRASQADLSAGREVTLNQYAGRAYPVATHGAAVARTIAVSAILSYPGDADSLEAQRDTVETVFVGTADLSTVPPTLYRDSFGRRFYCSLSAVQVPSEFMPAASFTVTQVDPGLGVVEGVVS